MKKLLITLFVSTLFLVSTGVVSAAPSVGKTAEFVPDEILVQFEPGANAADIAIFHRSQGVNVVSEIPEIGIQVLKVPSGLVLEKVAVYEKNPNVVYAEPNYIRTLQEGPPMPDDVFFPDQWPLNNTGVVDGVEIGTAGADINWNAAYETLSDKPLGSVIIAVNDTGIDPYNPDLNDNIIPGWDFVDQDDLPTDIPGSGPYGHGTHVAGIAAAETNNSEGIAGVAFGDATRIMPVRIFDEQGFTTVRTICDGVIFAADNGARVINMSYGGYFYSRSEAKAIKYAWRQGAVLVAAAGNDALTLKSYPAAYPEVIAVSATNNQDSLTDYSNYGNWISVAAPGGILTETEHRGGILSTYPTPTGYAYAWWAGTSMATPHVSGLAALLFSQDPSRSNQEVRNIIEETAKDLGTSGFDSSFGYGSIDAYKAIQYGEVPPPPPPPPPTENRMHIASIDVVSEVKSAGPNSFYYAEATLKVVDASDNPVSGVTVSGRWSETTSDADSRTTDSSGTVILTSDKLRNLASGTYTFTFTVSDLTRTDWLYDRLSNVADSGSTNVTVP